MMEIMHELMPMFRITKLFLKKGRSGPCLFHKNDPCFKGMFCFIVTMVMIYFCITVAMVIIYFYL